MVFRDVENIKALCDYVEVGCVVIVRRTMCIQRDDKGGAASDRLCMVQGDHKVLWSSVS